MSSTSQDNVIILFDIPSTCSIKTWSPNLWKARFTLNYKKLPYRTEWVEYPKIAEVCERIGADPTQVNVFGKEKLYTLPVIYDPATKRSISDSINIARYLDEQYPDTPRVLLGPDGQLGVFQHAFLAAFMQNAMPSAWQFLFPKANSFLNPESEAYFRLTREEFVLKKPMEEVTPKKETGDWEREWKKVEEGFGQVAGWFGNGGQEGQIFVTGNNPTFADFVIAGNILWFRTYWGEDSQEWKDISSWHGGRWGRIIKALEQYIVVV